MTFEDTQIGDPHSLSKAGVGATELAGETKAVGNRPVDETRAAARDFTGSNWEGGLGKALTDVAETWSRQSSGLQAICVTVGSQCKETAASYSSTETENTSVVQNVDKGARSPFG
ncbi:hypothetical protein ABZ851_23570 [Streptomyces sp. NPDC047049]|uniref:hypothetical protein n=1 Tax=Streptomyces sp. NPDC047049 TaxID=3156688 RepID=UPI0033E719DB